MRDAPPRLGASEAWQVICICCCCCFVMSHDECKIFQTLRLLIAPKFINYDELLKLLRCLCWTIEMQLVAATGNWQLAATGGGSRQQVQRVISSLEATTTATATLGRAGTHTAHDLGDRQAPHSCAYTLRERVGLGQRK